MLASDPALFDEQEGDDAGDHELKSSRLDTRAAVIAAIRTLGEEQQEVIILRHLEDRSYKEIAILLDKSEEALRAINSRAMKILKKKLKDY